MFTPNIFWLFRSWMDLRIRINLLERTVDNPAWMSDSTLTNHQNANKMKGMFRSRISWRNVSMLIGYSGCQMSSWRSDKGCQCGSSGGKRKYGKVVLSIPMFKVWTSNPSQDKRWQRRRRGEEFTLLCPEINLTCPILVALTMKPRGRGYDPFPKCIFLVCLVLSHICLLISMLSNEEKIHQISVRSTTHTLQGWKDDEAGWKNGELWQDEGIPASTVLVKNLPTYLP